MRLKSVANQPAWLVMIGLLIGAMPCGAAPSFYGAVTSVPLGAGATSDAACGAVTGDFNGDGKQDVVSYTRAGLSIQLGRGDGSLGTAQTIAINGSIRAAGTGGHCLAVADLNGDGKLDVVSVMDAEPGDTAPRGVVVWIGNGDGTFRTPVTYGGISGVNLSSVAVADLNHDGFPDIVILSQQDAGSQPSAVTVFLNHGDGTFGTPAAYPFPSGDANDLAIADVNGDGNLDVVATTFDVSQVVVFPGRGDGSFAAPSVVPLTHPDTAGAGTVAIGDVNGDGKPDIVVGSFNFGGAGQAGLYLLLGNGDGTFGAQTLIFSGEAYTSVVRDFTGDGKLDIAIGQVDWASSSTSIEVSTVLLPGNGDGTFGAPVPLYLFSGTLTSADMDGDGKPDLVGIGNGASSVELSVATHPFPVTYGLGTIVDTSSGGLFRPYALAVGDFNGDGRVDIAVPQDGKIVLLTNQGQGSFALTLPPSGVAFTHSADEAVTADFNGDGKLDIAYSDSNSGYDIVALGNGDGTFNLSRIEYPNNPGLIISAGLVATDMNGDGKPDLVALAGGRVLVMLGQGDGTFPSPLGGFFGTNAGTSDFYGIVAGDFNGDGKMDIAVGSDRTGKKIAILLGNGDGTLQSAQFTAPLPGASTGNSALQSPLVVGDFNGDGKLDLAQLTYDASNANQLVISVLLGRGDGTFAAPTVVPFPYATGSVGGTLTVTDVDHDGKLDLVVVGGGEGNLLVVLHGNGDGTFTQAESYAVANPSAIVAGDFTGSGFPSLAIGSVQAFSVTVLLNRAPAPVNPAPTVSVSLAPTTVAVGGHAMLTWASTNSTSCTASGAWSGTQATSGTLGLTPGSSGSLSYGLSCQGPGGTATAQATLTVTAITPAPTVTIVVAPTHVMVGDAATLTWTSTNATSCTASGNWSGAEPAAGSSSVTATSTGTASYTLACTGAGGTAQATTSLTVSAEPVVPTISLTVTPASVTAGDAATLVWSAASATSCSGSGAWTGTQATSGAIPLTTTNAGTQTYTLTCQGSGGGSASRSATLTIKPKSVLTTLIGSGGGGAFGLPEILALAALLCLKWRRRARLAAVAAAAVVVSASIGSAQAVDFGQAYVGVRVGENDYRPDVAVPAQGAIVSTDRSQTGGAFYVGVPVYRKLAVEVGYADFGQYRVQATTTQTPAVGAANQMLASLRPTGKAATLAAALPLPIGPYFTIEPRLGITAGHSRQEVDGGTFILVHDRNPIGYLEGVSALLHPTRALSIGFSASCYGTDGVRCDVRTYAGELRLHFGHRD